MNEPSNPNVEPGGMGQQENTASNPPEAPPVIGPCVFRPVADALKKGAADARKSAEEAAPKIRSALARAAYDVSYGLSFAAAWQYTVAKLLCPEVVKQGMKDGVRKGSEPGERFAQPKQADSPTPAPPGPAEQAAGI